MQLNIEGLTQGLEKYYQENGTNENYSVVTPLKFDTEAEPTLHREFVEADPEYNIINNAWGPIGINKDKELSLGSEQWLKAIGRTTRKDVLVVYNPVRTNHDDLDLYGSIIAQTIGNPHFRVNFISTEGEIYQPEDKS